MRQVKTWLGGRTRADVAGGCLESDTLQCLLLLLLLFGVAKYKRARNTSPKMTVKVINKSSALPYSTHLGEKNKGKKRVNKELSTHKILPHAGLLSQCVN